MKFFKSLALSFSLIALLSTNAMAAVTLGKAAELACHRLEKLVALGKADETFITKFSSLQITALQPVKPTDPAFKVTILQYPGVDGNVNQADIMLDANGKGIAQTVKFESEAVNAPEWSDKDALTLVEYALHYIADSDDVELQPFLKGLTSLNLKQFQNEGISFGKVTFNSKDTTKTLEINLNMNGTVESVQILAAD